MIYHHFFKLNFQQKPLKAKVKKKTLPKKSATLTKKATTVGKDESNKLINKKPKVASNKVKAKSATKSKPIESDSSGSESDSERESLKNVDRKPALKKLKKSIAQKAAISKATDVKEVVVRKRMASLNASAMMAATYEVERQLDKCEEKMYKVSAAATDADITPPKKAKEIKNEVFETKDVCISFPLVGSSKAIL